MANMLHVTPTERPERDAGYLEMMTKVIFMGGLNRQVVESKWEGFLDAFQQFDPPAVANFNEEDVERLSEDARIVRYGAKIEAVVANAREMVDLAAEHGSFGNWLQQLVQKDGVKGAAKLLAERFRYISEDSAVRYLYAVGEDVGQVSEKVRQKYGPSY